MLPGDLLNDWWMTAPEETAAFAALAEAIDAWRAAGVTVHVLLGNHDLIYIMPQDSPEAHRMRACSPAICRARTAPSTTCCAPWTRASPSV